MANPISYQDPSLQLLNTLMNLGGTKQSGKTTTTADPAAIKALQDILATQMGMTTPEGMSSIINALWQQGSRQVPIIATQFAQSAGARASNNSPLNQANQQLQARLAEVAAQQLMAAQQNASQTAGRLADSSKTTSSSQTSKPKNSALALLPFALGQAGNIKKLGQGVMDLFSGGDTGFGSVPGGSGVEGFIGNNPSAYIAPDLGAGMDFSNMPSVDMDFMPVSDLGMSIGDIDWSPILDGISNADAFTSVDYGAFFADGGLVRAKEVMGGSALRRREEEALGEKKEAPKKEEKKEENASDYKPKKNFGVRLMDYLKGYADGGVVKKSSVNGYADGGQVRGVNASSTGGDTVIPITNEFTTVAPSPTSDEPAPPTTNTGLDFSNERISDAVISYFANYEYSNSGWQPDAFYHDSTTGKGYTPMSSVATSRPQGEAGYDTPVTYDLIRELSPGYDSMGTDKYFDNYKYDKVYNPDGSFNTIQLNKPEGSDLGMILGAIMTAAGMMTGNPALAFAKGVGMRTAGEGVKGILNDRNIPDLGGVNRAKQIGKPGYANGGEIEGPGTGTSDSIPIRVSDGEYIIPADVVETLGVEFFDELRTMFHTPASMQRYHASNVRG